MDNYNTVLDLLEHPGHYSAAQIDEILSDPEAREIYNILCKTRSACGKIDDITTAEVDEQWKSFSRKHFKPRRRFFLAHGRAASIAAIAFTSLAAVALGVAVSVGKFERNDDPVEKPQAPEAVAMESVVAPRDTAVAVMDSAVPLLMEDETLENILECVASHYGVSVAYANPDAANLHLYYRFDPTLSLEKVVESLNTFEQINIRVDGKTLIVE